jgi:hypothetical protein
VPGEIATVRIPFGPHSTARLRVKAERPIGESGIHQALDSFGRADVDDMSSNLAGKRLFELPSGIEDLRPAAADHQLGTELDHPAHRLAEPGAPTGDQDAFSLEKIQLEHVRSFAFNSRRASIAGGSVAIYQYAP